MQNIKGKNFHKKMILNCQIFLPIVMLPSLSSQGHNISKSSQWVLHTTLF